MGTIPTDVLGLFDVVLAVGRGTDELGFVSLGPDDDVLPVVTVTSSNTANVLEGYVLLEVVAVHVDTPPVVASLTNVGVAVVQETCVTASGSVGCVAVVESWVESAVCTDGGDVVATVGIEVKGGLEPFVQISSASRDLGGVIPAEDLGTGDEGRGVGERKERGSKDGERLAVNRERKGHRFGVEVKDA